MEPEAPTPTFFEFTAPVRVEGESDAQTIFTWMVANRYLWMLEGGWADRVEDLVGTARLIGLAGRRMRFRRKTPEHEALRLPAEESAREYAYRRLARFLQMHFVLDEVVNASRETPAPLPHTQTRSKRPPERNTIMKKHPLEILVSGICAAAALALALSAGAQAPAPDPKAESPQMAPMNAHHQHHPVAAAEHDADMKTECQAMMAKKQKMEEEGLAMAAKLDEMVAQMNAAATSMEPDAMEKMAAVITELVAQRKTARSMKMEMQPEMMAHMMHHRDMHGTKGGTKGAMGCPMMMTEMGETSEPMAEETQPTE